MLNVYGLTTKLCPIILKTLLQVIKFVLKLKIGRRAKSEKVDTEDPKIKLEGSEEAGPDSKTGDED